MCVCVCVCVCAHALSHVWIFCDRMHYSPSGASVHGILQAQIQKWVAMPFSRGSSQPRDQSCISCIGRRILFFTTEPPGKSRSPWCSQKTFFLNKWVKDHNVYREEGFCGLNSVPCKILTLKLWPSGPENETVLGDESLRSGDEGKMRSPGWALIP